MTWTCATCYDPDCERVGADLRACEHHVRADDVEVEPPDEMSATDTVLGETIERVDVLEGRVDRLYEVLAAAVKAQAGEGL